MKTQIKRKNLGKKAISNIIASILFIILAISIILILYVYIKNSAVLLSPESCIDMLANQPISISNSCYNQETSTIEITLNKNNEKQASSIDFLVNFGEEIVTWHCGIGCSGCKILSEGSKTYYLYSENMPKKLTLFVNNCKLETKDINQC